MNNHRHLTNINTITSLLELIFYVTKTSIKTRMLTEGVSETDKRLETHMALPKIAKDWTSAGMGMLVAAGLTFASVANDADKAFAGEPLQKTATSTEITKLIEATRSANKYAVSHYGVGIVIHVGQDIPNRHFKSADEFGQAVVNLFKERYGVDAQYFLSPNDTKYSGMTYHIGHLIHGAGNGTEVKSVKQGLKAMGDVVEQLKIVKELAQAPLDKPIPDPG